MDGRNREEIGVKDASDVKILKKQTLKGRLKGMNTEQSQKESVILSNEVTQYEMSFEKFVHLFVEQVSHGFEQY